MIIYCIHDKKAKTYETPFVLPNNAYAIRSFQDAVNKDTPYGKYPEDFELVVLGEYNQDTGEIKPSKIEKLVSAKDVKNEK